jgi:hypothetical protein
MQCVRGTMFQIGSCPFAKWETAWKSNQDCDAFELASVDQEVRPSGEIWFKIVARSAPCQFRL